MNSGYQEINGWEVDYGQGPLSVTVPHCWGADGLDVRWEGPALYTTEFVATESGQGWLCFRGVSAWCRVCVNGGTPVDHLGIWDAFLVSFVAEAGATVRVEVEVIKNGGTSYPVNSIASGFLPFVYHTFGGIYDRVEVHYGLPPELEAPAPPSAVQIVNNKLHLDGRPTYIRGLLTWGWYPEFGHPRPPLEVFKRELDHIQALGFNLVKFCLWVPSHEFLEELERRRMWAWMEIPVWFPRNDPEYLRQIGLETERIVRQYRRHRCIIAWTAGCEVGAAMPYEARAALVSKIQALTGCPLVKDSSGGAEMYGGDPREAGTFEDFHPYCDLMYFASVLDQLAPGPRRRGPILLGEFNDFDAHRDLQRLAEERPYWMSKDPAKNHIGVRWQHDMPDVITQSRFALGDARHQALMESSRLLKLNVHRWVNSSLRMRGYAAGMVITGWRDTPISSSGIFDDWGQPRFTAEEFAHWNGPLQLVEIGPRNLPWVRGGNRPVGPASVHRFPGPFLAGIAAHDEVGGAISVEWDLKRGKEIIAEGQFSGEVNPLETSEIGKVYCEHLDIGNYSLSLRSKARQYERIVSFEVVAEFSAAEFHDWTLDDSDKYFDDIGPLEGSKKVLSTHLNSFEDLLKKPTLLFIQKGPILHRPILREAAYLAAPELADFPVSDASKLRLFSSDCVLDPAQLPSGCVPLVTRVDTRTYEETWLVARYGPSVISSLCPYGGTWNQPPRLLDNAMGTSMLRMLGALVK